MFIYVVYVVYLVYLAYLLCLVTARYSCKIFYYLNCLACLPSPWFLVYISIEKCISIVYPTKRLILKKQLYQYIYIFSVYIFSSLFSAYLAVEIDLSQQGNYTICNVEDYTRQLIINWMYSISSVYLPFIAMIIFYSLN